MEGKVKYMTELDVLGTKRALEQGFKRIHNGLLIPSFYNHNPVSSLESLDELMNRDKQREEDGFKKKIKFRNILAGPGKIISVPFVEEEKLIHGEFEPKRDDDEEAKEGERGSDSGEGEDGDLGKVTGQGQGQVGDVIGEAPMHDHGEGEGEGEEPQAGQGEGEHGFEEEAYKKGKELAEKFQLPNLRDKGKKVPTDEYTYDLTDRHRGSGQILDKKETLKSIIKTNIVLGLIDKDKLDTDKMIVGPNDKVYRVLSKEKVWKSMAVVFFARDYSGSMFGEPTRIILEQHLMVYELLMFQYKKLVIPRFFVHDTRAKEVTVKEYFSLAASGGTYIPSVYQEITKTVESESLAKNYNIYVLQGTDGDDADDGTEAIPEIEKILGYARRMGVCVLKHPYYSSGRETPFEEYIKKGGFLERQDVFRIHVMPSEGVTEDDNIKAIKELIAQD